ncbi:MAG: N-acetyltransferase [Pseudonocardiales bacterium]
MPAPDLPSVRIRPEADGEQAAVRAVVGSAFAHHPVVADLVDALRVSPAWVPGLSFVAERGGDLIGYVLATRHLLDAPRRLVEVLVISPLGVAPARHGDGVGSALILHCLGAVADHSEPLVFLEGPPAYYRRFGFRPAGDMGLRRPSLRIPEPAFMVVPLPSYEPWMTGTLVYAEPIWRLDCVGLRETDRD